MSLSGPFDERFLNPGKRRTLYPNEEVALPPVNAAGGGASPTRRRSAPPGSPRRSSSRPPRGRPAHFFICTCKSCERRSRTGLFSGTILSWCQACTRVILMIKGFWERSLSLSLSKTGSWHSVERGKERERDRIVALLREILQLLFGSICLGSWRV